MLIILMAVNLLNQLVNEFVFVEFFFYVIYFICFIFKLQQKLSLR